MSWMGLKQKPWSQVLRSKVKALAGPSSSCCNLGSTQCSSAPLPIGICCVCLPYSQGQQSSGGPGPTPLRCDFIFTNYPYNLIQLCLFSNKVTPQGIGLQHIFQTYFGSWLMVMAVLLLMLTGQLPFWKTWCIELGTFCLSSQPLQGSGNWTSGQHVPQSHSSLPGPNLPPLSQVFSEVTFYCRLAIWIVPESKGGL